MRTLCCCLLFMAAVLNRNSVCADVFGGGASSFEIDFVTIGSAGNAPDTTGDPNPAGAVAYEFRIGKNEISEQMIEKANALGGHGRRSPATQLRRQHLEDVAKGTQHL